MITKGGRSNRSFWPRTRFRSALLLPAHKSRRLSDELSEAVLLGSAGTDFSVLTHLLRSGIGLERISRHAAAQHYGGFAIECCGTRVGLGNWGAQPDTIRGESWKPSWASSTCPESAERTRTPQTTRDHWARVRKLSAGRGDRHLLRRDARSQGTWEAARGRAAGRGQAWTCCRCRAMMHSHSPQPVCGRGGGCGYASGKHCPDAEAVVEGLVILISVNWGNAANWLAHSPPIALSCRWNENWVLLA